MVVKEVMLLALQVEKVEERERKIIAEAPGNLLQEALRRNGKVYYRFDGTGPVAHHVYFSDLHVGGMRPWHIS